MDLSDRFYKLIENLMELNGLAKNKKSKDNIKVARKNLNSEELRIPQRLFESIRQCRTISKLLYGNGKNLVTVQADSGDEDVFHSLINILDSRTSNLEHMSNQLIERIKNNQEDCKNHVEAIKVSRKLAKYGEEDLYVECYLDDELLDLYNDKMDELGMDSRILQKKTDEKSLNKAMKIKTKVLTLRDDLTWLIERLTQDEKDQNEILEKSKSIRRKCKNIYFSFCTLQSLEYKNSKLYYTRINKTGNLIKMVNPKKKGGLSSNSFYPSKHGEAKRLAISWEEKKEATLETHKIWTDHPPGAINCHFTSVLKGVVGPFDVVLHSGNFDENSFQKYIENNERIEEVIKIRIFQAHKNIAEFIELIKEQPQRFVYHFSYDFSGKFSKPEIREEIRKATLLGRGKARTDGFTLGVLGRFPAVFTEIFMLKTEIHLTLRLIDRNKQNSLRICIPKPDGSVRPITVASDDLCFTNHLLRVELHKELENNKALPENLISFRKGKNCSDATITDNVIRELSLQNNDSFVAIISEDIEKMYDRIHIDLQGLILKYDGADKGYINWQLNNMHDRTNTLVTDIFQENINYKCGLPQGINMSVELSNLYSSTYMKWLERAIDKLPIIKGYELNIDGIIHVIKNMGYVDDTTIYLMAKKLDISTEDFLKLVQAILDAAADFSLVFKVGRNPKKCTVTLYNIENNVIIPDFHSIAWSFENRGPLKAIIKPQVVRCTSEGDLIKYAKNFAFAESDILDTLKHNRYLGVSKNAFQENDEQINSLCLKMKDRLYKISNRANHPEEIRIIHNSIVCSTATFSPLCIQFPFRKTMEMDRFTTKIYSKAMGYGPSDSKHAIFISERKGGHNLKPFTCEFLCSLIRELEVNLCSDKPHGIALKKSIEVATKLTKSKEDPSTNCRKIVLKRNMNKVEDTEQKHVNLMGSAMKLTTSFGVYLRYLKEEWIVRICNELVETDCSIQVIGGRGIEKRGEMGNIIEALNKDCHKAHDYNLDGRIHIFLSQAIHNATKLAITKGITDEDLINKFIKMTLQNKTFLLDNGIQWGSRHCEKKECWSIHKSHKRSHSQT